MTLTRLAVESSIVFQGRGNGGGDASLNTDGIRDWALDNIVPVLLLVIGIGIIAGARKLKGADVATTSIITVVGIIFCVGAGLFVAIANGINGIALN